MKTFNIDGYEVYSFRRDNGNISTRVIYNKKEIFHTGFGTSLIDSKKKARELVEFVISLRNDTFMQIFNEAENEEHEV